MSTLRKPTTFKDFKQSHSTGLTQGELDLMQEKLRKQLALVDSLAVKMERPVLTLPDGQCTLGSIISLINEELADVRLKKQGLSKDVLKALQYSLAAASPKKTTSKADRIAQGLQAFRDLAQSAARRNSSLLAGSGPIPRLPRCGKPPDATDATVPLLKYNNWLRNSKKALYAMYSFHLQRNFTPQQLQKEEAVLLDSLVDVADKIRMGRFNRWIQRGPGITREQPVAPARSTSVSRPFTKL